MKKNLLLSLSLVLFVTSCSQTEYLPSDVLPYVTEILSDTSLVWNKSLYLYDRSLEGSIAVVGQQEDIDYIAGSLLDCDLFDNGSFAERHDDLNDFSGETIDSYVDNTLVGDYQTYFNVSGQDSLRISAVNLAMAAICDQYWSSKYEPLPDASKLSAKLLVIASIEQALTGASDIRYIFEKASVNVGLVDPLQAVVSEVKARKLSDMMVWTDLDSLLLPQYQSALEQSMDSSEVSVKMFVDDGSSYEKQFETILASCLVQNTNYPVLIVDHKVNRDECARALVKLMNRIKDEDSEKMAALRKLFSEAPDTIFLEEAIGKYCYRWLRENDMLTLKIAPPYSNDFTLASYKGNSVTLH